MEPNLPTRLMVVVWPAFLVAAAAETLLFAFVDPVDLGAATALHEPSRVAIYTLAFIVFWMVGIAAAALTLRLTRDPGAQSEAGAEARRGQANRG